VTVAGTGVLGAQIAFQAAYHDFNVVAYDINDDLINSTKTKPVETVRDLLPAGADHVFDFLG
jgi:3-hydroxyacyl-CoA dehydrogenase